MKQDWEELEKKLEEIRKENDKYLEIFREDIKGLSDKTIERHLSNVEFYLNEYLLEYEGCSMEQGVDMLDSYLGSFFIRKCMWSTPASIKSNAASIKKFYKSMMQHGFIEAAAYGELCDDIKYGMEDWQDDCAIYNDPDSDEWMDIIW